MYGGELLANISSEFVVVKPRLAAQKAGQF